MEQTAKITTFNGVEVTVRELTVAQVIRLLKISDDREPINIDLLLDMPGAADITTAATGLTMKKLSMATPSMVAELFEVVKKVNPHYAGAAQRIKDEMARIRQLLPPGLNEMLAVSSSVDSTTSTTTAGQDS